MLHEVADELSDLAHWNSQSLLEGHNERKQAENAVFFRRAMHKQHVHLHILLCGWYLFLDAVFPHQRLEIRTLHADVPRSLRNIPVISYQRLFDEEFLDLLNG